MLHLNIQNKHKKEFLWTISGQIFSVIASLLSIKLITSYLNPEQYGELMLVLTIAMLLNQIITGGFTSSFNRYYSIAVEDGCLHFFLKAAIDLSLKAIGASLILGLLAISTIYYLNYDKWILSIILVCVYSCVNFLNSSINSIQNAARKRNIVAFNQIIEGSARILILILILSNDNNINGIIAGYCFATIITILIQSVYTKIIYTKGVSDNKAVILWKNRLKKYAMPFTIWGIFTAAYQMSDKWALEFFSSTSDVGYYGVLYQLGYAPISLVTGLAVSYLGPIIFERFGGGGDGHRKNHANQMGWNLTMLAIALTVLGFIFSFIFYDLIFKIFVSEKYATVAHLLPWLIMAGGLYSAGQVIGLNILSNLRPHMMLRPKIILSILGVCLNLIGAKINGVVGLIWAINIFSIFYLLWMIYIANILNNDLKKL